MDRPDGEARSGHRGDGEPDRRAVDPEGRRPDSEDSRLLDRFARTRDPGARDALVARYLPLARSLARRYSSAGEPLEDLEQVAGLALVKAIDRFEPGRGIAFTSFAVPTIAGELARHLRDHERTVRLPRALYERIGIIGRASTELTAELGRSPTPREIAEHGGLGTEQVIEALMAQTAADPLSLDAPVHGPLATESLGESVGGSEEGYGEAEQRALMAPALRSLPALERVVVHLRFAEDLTQSEIAARVGTSQVQVSRVLRRALDRLRKITAAEG